MMPDFDRIRILWIDDLPTVQTEDLGFLSEFFEIVAKEGKPCWLRSIDDYEEIRAEHENCNQHDSSPYLPVEIVSADYDLSKFSGNDSVGPRNFEGAEKPKRPPTKQKLSGKIVKEINPDDVNHEDFDGCLINLFYLSDFSNHPCGSVVTTYQDPNRQNRVAKKLETHMERIYGIAPLYPSQKNWDIILSTGTVALRKRIKRLYEDSKIVLSVSDLIAMADGVNASVLTLKSEFTTRKLPVRGLFIDCKDNEEMASTISEWASMLLQLKVSREHYRFAKEVAEKIWNTYNDDELLSSYQEFSSLHTSLYGVNGQEIHVDEQLELKYDRYAKYFGLRETKRIGKEKVYECTSEKCLDINSISLPVSKKSQKESNTIVRWAIIFLILKLMKRALICKAKLEKQLEEVISQQNSQKIRDIEKLLSPFLDVDDIYLLLFPVPKSPFPSPWHIANPSVRARRKETWQKTLGRKGINLKDFLNGNALTHGERCLIQGILINDDEFIELGDNEESRLDIWRSWMISSQFVFGC
ncbi:MAG: hypothetical protein ACFB0C_02350 [Leptolyngbyaceae cyanobacterium]